MVSAKKLSTNVVKCGIKWRKVYNMLYIYTVKKSYAMDTFTGDYNCKLDVKGRVMFPSALKRQVHGEEFRFVIKKDIFEKCLTVYSIEEWNRQIQTLQKKLNPYNKSHNTFLRKFYKDTAEVELDAGGRLLIPKKLIKEYLPEKDITMSGQGFKIEIWSRSDYENTNIPDTDFANMAESLMGDLILNDDE